MYLSLDLTNYKRVDFFNDEFIIREVKQHELDEWAKRVALGFGYPEAQEQFTHYVRAKGSDCFCGFMTG